MLSVRLKSAIRTSFLVKENDIWPATNLRQLSNVFKRRAGNCKLASVVIFGIVDHSCTCFVASISELFRAFAVKMKLGRKKDNLNDLCLLFCCFVLSVEKHGEMADELGEVYMVYGRALLDLSR